MRSLVNWFAAVEDKHRDSDFGMGLGDSLVRNQDDPWWHEDGLGEEDDDDA